MKKLFVGILMVMVMVGFVGVVGATDVGGIINIDTTWDLAGSPYEIVNPVHVDTGIILTIEPGVVVNGELRSSTSDIYVWGVLDVIGNSNSKIIFNNVIIFNNWAATINLDYCKFNDGSPSYNNTGYNLIITNSILEDTRNINIRLEYVYSYSNDILIEKNIFINSDRINISIGAGPNDELNYNIYIKNNVFYNQTYREAIKSYSQDYSYEHIFVEYNSFLSVDKIALAVGNDGNMLAINNFWNTTDENIIESMIHDRNDDLNCVNYIDYIPFLTEAHPDTPYFDPTPDPPPPTPDPESGGSSGGCFISVI